MTAYEEFKYDTFGEISAVLPATPQSVWAEQVLEFALSLKEQKSLYEDPSAFDPEVVSHDYQDGYYDAAEHIMSRFCEIFNVEITPTES
jgi:hypothetical protein